MTLSTLSSRLTPYQPHYHTPPHRTEQYEYPAIAQRHSPPERTPLSANHFTSSIWTQQPTSIHTPKAIATSSATHYLCTTSPAMPHDVINCSSSSPMTQELSPTTHKTQLHPTSHYITSPKEKKKERNPLHKGHVEGIGSIGGMQPYNGGVEV